MIAPLLAAIGKGIVAALDVAIVVDRTVAAARDQLKKLRRRNDAWAERPNEPKGCARCKAHNYLGGSVCSSCGWPI